MSLRWTEPSSQLPYGSQDESDAFSYFQNTVMRFLSGAFDPEIWRHLVLPVSVTEPSVKHAVIALGSIRNYEEDMARKHKMNKFAIHHYSKALKALHASLSVPGRATADLVLVTCLLFIAFELQQFGLDQVASHFKGGIQIVRELQDNPRSLKLSASKEALDPLVEAFERLDIQMSLFTSNRVSLNQTPENAVVSELPAQMKLTDLKEASRCLNRHMAAMRELVHAVNLKCFSLQGLSAEDYGIFQVQATHQLASLHLWSQSIEELLSTLPRNCDRSSARAMQSHHICCKLMVSASLNNGCEMLWDSYLADFTLLLDTVDDSLLNCASDPLDPKSGTKMSSGFSLDMGLIPPLYFTAIKCRDPTLRRRAIASLDRCKHQEGAWDGRQMVGLATQIMKLEERGLSNLQCASDVPEQNRLYQAYYDLRRSAHVLYCKRRRFESDGEWTIYEEHVA